MKRVRLSDGGTLMKAAGQQATINFSGGATKVTLTLILTLTLTLTLTIICNALYL